MGKGGLFWFSDRTVRVSAVRAAEEGGFSASGPCTVGSTGQSGSTHLQKLNKTCRGQTKPEAVRPLDKQRHEEERIMERYKQHDEEQHTTWTQRQQGNPGWWVVHTCGGRVKLLP